MDFRLELVLIPVSDVDRAKRFYTQQAGFDLLVDTPVDDEMRSVQVTPPRSACSIGFGTGLGLAAAPGSFRGLHLVVPDIIAARAGLTERGVDVTEVRYSRAVPGLRPAAGAVSGAPGRRPRSRPRRLSSAAARRLAARPR